MRIEEKQFKKFIVDSGLVSDKDISAAEKSAIKKGNYIEINLLFINDPKL